MAATTLDAPDTAMKVPEITMSHAVRLCGGVPHHRIRLLPYPATVDDVETIRRRERRAYELIEGVLVEKAMSYQAGFIAAVLIRLLANYVVPRNLGAVAGADGMMEIAPGLVRIPDVSFVVWDQFPNRQVPSTPVPNIHPDLAVEVLSPGNTTKEMDRKLADYFASGARAVWIVDPKDQSVTVFDSPEREAGRRHSGTDTLDGGMVLPGFTLLVRDIFTELGPH